jgi:hypothetical protein
MNLLATAGFIMIILVLGIVVWDVISVLKSLRDEEW